MVPQRSRGYINLKFIPFVYVGKEEILNPLDTELREKTAVKLSILRVVML